ncbi:MAG: DUF4159 domain-containing protein [Bradymonadales bacterium]|nr:DUF4159 domain-containing protein [Bradymonadales bacterium]
MMTISRRAFVKTLLGASAYRWFSPSLATAFGTGSAFGVGRIRYQGGNWDPRPDALHKLLLEVEKRTSILVDGRCPPVTPAGAALFDSPFTLMAGDTGFEPLSSAACRNLETYLRAGGTLLVDSCEGDASGQFYQAVRRELDQILPGIPLRRVPSNHVVYQSFYLVDQPVGRTVVAPYLEACELDNRLLVLLSHNDLLGAWARDNFGNWLYEVYPGGERQREMAFRLGINLVMYTLCQDYKEDQVHIPFILHRRQWRLE